MSTIDQAIAQSAYTKVPGEIYLSTDRFRFPKETTKFYGAQLAALTEQGRSYTLADIACGGGEMIHYFRQCFPHWAFHGFDINPDYVRFANAQPALQGVPFKQAELSVVEGIFDIVTFFGTITIFWDYEPPITKLLSLCKPGGLVLIDGYFSPDEVELRCSYRDKTRADATTWCRDWSIFTRSGLREFLADKAAEVNFYDVPIGIDLPRDLSKPHSSVWTFKDSNGQRHLTNGTHIVLDDTLMVIRK